MSGSVEAVVAMSMHNPHDRFDGAAPVRSGVKSSFRIMPDVPKQARTNSFIFGRSDSRIRPLLNQEERDRLHCWAMIVALASSAAGTALLIAAAFA